MRGKQHQFDSVFCYRKIIGIIVNSMHPLIDEYLFRAIDFRQIHKNRSIKWEPEALRRSIVRIENEIQIE